MISKIVKITGAKRKGKRDHHVITVPVSIMDELRFRTGDRLLIESDVERQRFTASLLTFTKKGEKTEE